MSEIRVSVSIHKLSDGSEAYQVQIADDVAIEIPAVTEDDANLLAVKIAQAIHAHTNEEVSIYTWNGRLRLR